MQKACARRKQGRVENYWGQPRCNLIFSEKLQKTVGLGNEREEGGGKQRQKWSKYSSGSWSSYSAPNISGAELH